eukprot:6438019-Amphidinium_carterae.1
MLDPSGTSQCSQDRFVLASALSVVKLPPSSIIDADEATLSGTTCGNTHTLRFSCNMWKTPTPIASAAVAARAATARNIKLYHHHRPKSSPKQKEKRTQMTKNTKTINIFELYMLFDRVDLELWGSGTIFAP